MHNLPDPALLWSALLWPLLRLLMALAAGLLIANVIESLRWMRFLAQAATPLARAAHLREVAAASFSLAFLSPSGANALLGESYDKGQISGQELMLANLFNSLPSYIVHTPTIFFLTFPVLGWPAVVYVGLTLGAAAARTLLTIGLGRWLLPPLPAVPPVHVGASCPLPVDGISWKTALHKAWQRFVRRVPKLVFFTVPVYIVMFVLQHTGVFQAAETWMQQHVQWLSFLKPQAMGIIVLHLAAEVGAAISAAGSVLDTGGLASHDVVLALLVGNILSTPMRALRHQLPAYAGYFRPVLAARLVLANQTLRAASLVVMAMLYYWYWH